MIIFFFCVCFRWNEDSQSQAGFNKLQQHGIPQIIAFLINSRGNVEVFFLLVVFSFFWFFSCVLSLLFFSIEKERNMKNAIESLPVCRMDFDISPDLPFACIRMVCAS